VDGGCEVCRADAPADKKWQALATVAVRSDGPTFLKRCGSCGPLWHETLHDMRAVNREQAEALYPDSPLAE
jgi:hypothetical protein